jgi:hypothetical protein
MTDDLLDHQRPATYTTRWDATEHTTTRGLRARPERPASATAGWPADSLGLDCLLCDRRVATHPQREVSMERKKQTAPDTRHRVDQGISTKRSEAATKAERDGGQVPAALDWSEATRFHRAGQEVGA